MRSGLGGRTRHVQVQWLWVQEAVERKDFGVKKVPSLENLADILTKPVPSEVFNKHLRELGFIFPPRLKVGEAVNSETICVMPPRGGVRDALPHHHVNALFPFGSIGHYGHDGM